MQSAYEATMSNSHIKNLVSFILQSFVNSTLGFLMKEKWGPFTQSHVICTRLHVADRQAIITVSRCLRQRMGGWGGW